MKFKIIDEFGKQPNNIVKFRFSRRNVIIISVIAGIIAITIAISVILSLNIGYDVSNYLDITTNGYNGAGTLQVKFDSEQFLSDLHSNGQSENVTISDLQPVFTVANNGNLSNGSNAVISFSSKAVPLKTANYCVTDLQEPASVNPFDGLTIVFSGADGTGTAVVNTDNCLTAVQQHVIFSVSPNNNLSNRDTVSVTASADNFLLQSGYILSNQQQNYDVQGLIVYPDDLTGIDCSSSNKLLKEAILNQVNNGGIYLNWSYSDFKTDDWYLFGVFDFNYSIVPLSTYYSYAPDQKQNNCYYSLFRVELNANCKKVSTLKENASSVKDNNLTNGCEVNGIMYFVSYCNSVCLTKDGKSLVFPYLDKEYQSDNLSTFISLKNFSSENAARAFITENKTLSVTECLPFL